LFGSYRLSADNKQTAMKPKLSAQASCIGEISLLRTGFPITSNSRGGFAPERYPDASLVTHIHAEPTDVEEKQEGQKDRHKSRREGCEESR
jgi:hypothetical protein